MDPDSDNFWDVAEPAPEGSERDMSKSMEPEKEQEMNWDLDNETGEPQTWRCRSRHKHRHVVHLPSQIRRNDQ